MIVSETQKPPEMTFVDSWERGLDPWHSDAFSSEFKNVGTTGERKSGWFGLDWCGNVVVFVPDETEIKTKDRDGSLLDCLEISQQRLNEIGQSFFLSESQNQFNP